MNNASSKSTNGDDIYKTTTEAQKSGVKITPSANKNCLNLEELNRISREASEKGYAAHVNSYKNLDFKNVSLKNENPITLNEIEKKFLKALSNQ